MRGRLLGGLVGVAVALLGSAGVAHAVSVTAQNFGGQVATTSTLTYFFPTTPGNTGCTTQQKTLAVDGSRANPTPVNYAAGTTWADPNSLLVFQIYNSTPLTTITGQNPVQANSASVRVELVSPGVAGTALNLVPLNGASYQSGGTTTEIDYGTTDNTVITFGILLRDIVASDVSAGSTTHPQGVGGQGLCTVLASSGNDPTPANRDAAHFCAPSAGILPATVTLNFGIVAKGQALSNVSSDTTSKSGQNIAVVLADCPPGAASAGNFQAPNFVFVLVPVDQRVKLANNTQPYVDAMGTTVPITGVAVVADAKGNTLTLNSPVLRVNTAVSGGVYTIDGLTNDTTYCFTFGYINAPGWVSTDSTWSTAALATPNPAQCATPSQIDGFLNRSTCFIASAAYGEEWDPRLETLRQFRDQVLERFTAGRAFVSWYYSWSPPAAHWLIENPGYKVIVRVALLPLVEGARITLWIRANMWVFGLTLVLGTAATLAVLLRRRTFT